MTLWLRVATGASLVAGGVCAASLWLATRPTPRPDPERVPAATPNLNLASHRPPTPDSEIAVAVDHDPFAPDRHRPATRYQLPEEIAAANAVPSVPATGLPHLLGTVVSPGGQSGFAMCQVGTESPRVVRIGDVVSGLKLERVSQGAASFLSPTGSRIELSVLRASGT